MITVLGRLLEDGHPGHPQALLERARRPGRSMGSLARALEGFFTARGLALPTDHDERLAAGRRRRRIDAVPGPLRPAAESFAAFMLRARARALRAGTVPREDETIETALATVRDLARFMDGHLGKRDWALADVHDIEAFLDTLPKGRKRRLTVLRQFFRFARAQKIVLTDPTRGLSARRPEVAGLRHGPLAGGVRGHTAKVQPAGESAGQPLNRVFERYRVMCKSSYPGHRAGSISPPSGLRGNTR